MKKYLLLLILPLAILGFSACSGTNQNTAQETTDSVIVPTVPTGQMAAILKVMEEKGNPAVAGPYPSFIEAKKLFGMLNKKIAIFDLRSAEAFADGHIKGAKSLQFEAIPDYWEKNAGELAKLDTIVLVDSDGQISAYAAGLLRLNGNKNVFSLKFGMAVWNKQCADKVWAKGISSNFESKLDTAETKKPQFAGWPLTADSVANANAFFAERWKAAFAKPVPLVEAEAVFAETASYYPLNYDRKDRYQSGHIPGAVRYKPENLLGNLDEMASLPTNKTIAVYCNTGQNAAYVSAYLNLAGYDAKIINNGNNAFMHNKMKAEKANLSWIPLELSLVQDFPLVK